MAVSVSGATTGSSLPTTAGLPETGPSLLRVFGALVLVLGLFLGGVWLFRNGRQLAFRRGRRPLLNVIESRSLGGRHALYVIACDQERFLLASSPAGINLLSQLPSAPETEPETQPASRPAPALSFAQSLALVLKGSAVPGTKPQEAKG